MIAGTQDAELTAELDSGPRARERARLCAATRTVHPVSELIRFVVGPNGEAVPDVKSKLPGRGIWVTATRDAMGEAIKRRVFARGFKRDVRLPPDLVARTEHLLERAVLDALAIAGKAGLVAAGFGKVETALENEEVAGCFTCGRGCRRRNPQTRRGTTPPAAGPASRCDRIPYIGAIGFGIEPHKCGTCCPARRSCKRDFLGALPAP